MRPSGDTFEAYRSTKVPVHESQNDVRALLRGRKATGLQITESWLGGVTVADVRFAMPAESGHFAYRIRVNAAITEADLERRPHQRTLTAREAEDQKARQIWRLVYWWLKAQFEAADAGLVSVEEAFLPWMELPSGKTVYETTAETGALARVAAGSQPLLLNAGRES